MPITCQSIVHRSYLLFYSIFPDLLSDAELHPDTPPLSDISRARGLAASAADLSSSGVTNSLSNLQHRLEGSSRWIFPELQLHNLLQAEATRLAQVIHLCGQFNSSSSDLSSGTTTPPPTAVSSSSTGEDPTGPSASGDVAGSGADSVIMLDESKEMSPPDN